MLNNLRNRYKGTHVYIVKSIKSMNNINIKIDFSQTFYVSIQLP